MSNEVVDILGDYFVGVWFRLLGVYFDIDWLSFKIMFCFLYYVLNCKD